MQSVFQVTILENNMTEERMTRRIKQLEGEKTIRGNASIERTRQRRKTPTKKEATSNTALEEEENNALKEQVCGSGRDVDHIAHQFRQRTTN